VVTAPRSEREPQKSADQYPNFSQPLKLSFPKLPAFGGRLPPTIYFF
jgi:hypothetical protein